VAFTALTAETRSAADRCALYGLPESEVTPRLLCGLELNAERIRVQNVLDMATAFSIAIGNVEVPEQWLKLIAETPEEADRLRRSQTLSNLKAQVLSQLR